MITSVRNPRIAAVRRLSRRRERRATGLTTIEGPLLLEEAVAAGLAIRDVFVIPEDARGQRLAAAAGVTPAVVSDEVLQRIAGSTSPRGPVAVIEIPRPGPVAARDSVVMWEISDPGNAGTIIRTAAAFGYQVLATNDSVDLWAPKVVRSAVGAHFRETPIEGIARDLATLQQAGLQPILATAGSGEDPATALQGDDPVALIVGSEAHGLPDDLSSRPGVATVGLPMPGGTESLNAAVAVGILMYLRMVH